MPIKLAILLCDENLPEVVPGKPTPRFLWSEFFKDSPVEPTFFQLLHDDWPDIGKFDNYLISGSRLSVLDRLPWMLKLEHMIQDTFYKKIIGICFGHQMLAQSLKGKVEPGLWHIGVHPIQSTQGSASFSYPQTLNVRFNHQDHVCELPENALPIYTSAICEYASYIIGDTVLSMQYHPEFTQTYHGLLHKFNQRKYSEEVYQEGLKHMDNPSNHDVIKQQIIDFLNN